MKDSLFFRRFIDATKKKGIRIHFLLIYQQKLTITLDNDILFYIDYLPDRRKNYYKIINGVGYGFRASTDRDFSNYAENIIKLLHPYRENLRALDQVIYIDKDYSFQPDRIGDIFPFLSFEDKGRDSELLVRFTGKCNQRCEFCSAPIIDQEPDTDLIKSVIMNLQKRYRFQVTVTGGEPALRREFADFVRWVLRYTKEPVVRIQTNAVLFSNRSLLNRIPRSKRIQFFISLHSLEEKTYDIITSSKGQLTKAIDGIKNILKAGYDTIVNVVINRYNYDNMDEYLKNLFNVFGSKVKVHFSVLILPDYRNNLEKYVVSYKDVVKYVLPLMEKYNIPIESLVSSTHASIPLCFLPQKSRKDIRKNYRVNPAESDYNDLSKKYVKTEKCRVCIYNNVCPGIPGLYYRIKGFR